MAKCRHEVSLGRNNFYFPFTDEETKAQRKVIRVSGRARIQIRPVSSVSVLLIKGRAHKPISQSDLFRHIQGSAVALQREGLTAIVREDFIIKLGLEPLKVILEEAQETPSRYKGRNKTVWR